MKDIIYELMIQLDRYMNEEKELSTSLSMVKNVLVPLKLSGSLSDQVANLVRIVALKDQDLSTVRSSLGSTKK